LTPNRIQATIKPMARPIIRDILSNTVRTAKPTRWLTKHVHAEPDTAERTADEEAVYAQSVYRRHRDALTSHGPLAGSLLEIGPGDSLTVSGLFLKAGVTSAASIDIKPARGNIAAEAARILGIDAGRVEYVHPASIEHAPFPDGSFDIIISQAVMEHVRSPMRALAEISRLLRPGGLTSHQIDLRDHRDFAQPLAFLRYPGVVWRAATSHRTPTNRWRRSDFVDGFNRVGLEVLSSEATETVAVGEDEVRRLGRPFREKTTEDLGVLGVHIVARKLV
jgi:SAM-dependent methyltransferase